MASAARRVDANAIDEEERLLMSYRRLFLGNKKATAGPGAKALRTVAAPSDGGDCPICLDNEAGAAAWKEMPCRHSFHEACLEKWLVKDKDKASCPVCRRMLTPPSDLDDVYHRLRDIVQKHGKHLLGENYHKWSSREWATFYQTLVGVDQCLRVAAALLAEALPQVACLSEEGARAGTELADAKLWDAEQALSFASATAGHIAASLTAPVDAAVLRLRPAAASLKAAEVLWRTGHCHFNAATRWMLTYIPQRYIENERLAAVADLEAALQEARAAVAVTSAALADASLRRLRL